MNDSIKFQELKQLVQQRAGQRLPGERELTAQLEISRPHLRKLLELLEQEGLVQRRQGSGTYAVALGEGAFGRAVLLVDAALKLGDDPFFSLLVERLQGELQNAGAQCVIQRTSGHEVLLPRSDGVIALGVAGLDALSHATLNLQPAVGLFAASNARVGRNLSLLELDDENAGIEVAQRLIAQGVSRAYFFGRRAIPAVGERLTGVEAELGRAGIPLQVVECGLNYAAGLEQGFAFSATGTKPIGIVAANDWLAVGLHTGLQSNNPTLRQRVTLLSFDGLALTRRPELRISSLGVPLDNMAKDAVAELQRLKQRGAVGRTIRYALDWNPATDFQENDK